MCVRVEIWSTFCGGASVEMSDVLYNTILHTTLNSSDFVSLIPSLSLSQFSSPGSAAGTPAGRGERVDVPYAGAVPGANRCCLGLCDSPVDGMVFDRFTPLATDPGLDDARGEPARRI